MPRSSVKVPFVYNAASVTSGSIQTFVVFQVPRCGVPCPRLCTWPDLACFTRLVFFCSFPYSLAYRVCVGTCSPCPSAWSHRIMSICCDYWGEHSCVQSMPLDLPCQGTSRPSHKNCQATQRNAPASQARTTAKALPHSRRSDSAPLWRSRFQDQFRIRQDVRLAVCC